MFEFTVTRFLKLFIRLLKCPQLFMKLFKFSYNHKIEKRYYLNPPKFVILWPDTGFKKCNESELKKLVGCGSTFKVLVL